MNKVIALILFFSLSVCLHAAMTTETITLAVGESLDLTTSVQWPCPAAFAYFDRPIAAGGVVTSFISFSQESRDVTVTGPVVITLSYGTPDPVSTPDAIGGGE